jgi:hypothetical protein
MFDFLKSKFNYNLVQISRQNKIEKDYWMV